MEPRDLVSILTGIAVPLDIYEDLLSAKQKGEEAYMAQKKKLEEAQTRKLDMMEVLSYPLGPKPWPLANGDGLLKKTDKSTLGRHTEKEAVYTDFIDGSRTTIVDAMGIVQKITG
ncbi:hypothetical protein SK128_003385 [Halocaridina rubra]|uniref:Uncharacterized protein n=1 Tax=Halocaridina rubra TaxID=373956 RepID=A0AAN8WMV7_HALRR